MKRNSRNMKLFWRIFLGFLCFLILAASLCLVQFCVAVYQYYENAHMELALVNESLNSSQFYDELAKTYDEQLQDFAQLAILLLEDSELNNEKLEEVAGMVTLLDTIMIIDADGTPLYTCGPPIEDRDFLLSLIEKRFDKRTEDSSCIALPFRENTYLVAESLHAISVRSLSNSQYDLQIKLDGVTAGLTNEILIADAKSGKIVYGSPSYQGKNLNSFFFTLNERELELDVHPMFSDNTIRFAVVHREQNYLIVSIAGLDTIFLNFHSAIIPALFGFGFLIFLLIAYTEFIRADMRANKLGSIHYVKVGKKRYLNTALFRKLVGFSLIGITFMVCIVYCLQLLIRADGQRQKAEYRLSIASQLLEENHDSQKESEQFAEESRIESAQIIKSILEYNPALVNKSSLSSAARLFDAEAIYVMDNDGKTIATNTQYAHYSLQSVSQTDAAAFWDIMNGFSQSHTQLVRADSRSQNKDVYYVSIPGLHGQGLLQIVFPCENQVQNEKEQAKQVLGTISVDPQSLLLAVDSASGDCIFDSTNQYTGRSVYQYGIKESYLNSGYSGTHRFDYQECMINTLSSGGLALLYITPTNWITANSWIFTILVVVVSLLVVALAIFSQLLVRSPGADIRLSASKPPKVVRRIHVDASLSADGQVVLVENHTEHYSWRTRWNQKNAGEKLRTLISILLILLASYMLFFLIVGRGTGSFPLLNRILERNWDKKLNVYAISYIAIVVSGIWLGARILQKITLFVTGTFSSRWKTSGILLSNIIRYAAFIASIFFALQNIGVETSTLITSASILTLVFGLGSQSFVADFIAGIFLIFEGTFRVGDIVTIDGWRGEVVEIGLRATKVKNSLGNVKIFQNSRISGAINMTSDQTYAVCDIALPNGVPLEEFEQKLIASFFPLAREKVQNLQHPLTYEGVIAVTGAGATLRISVRCLEIEREQLQRELYRTLKLWQEQN